MYVHAIAEAKRSSSVLKKKKAITCIFYMQSAPSSQSAMITKLDKIEHKQGQDTRQDKNKSRSKRPQSNTMNKQYQNHILPIRLLDQVDTN